MESRNNPTIGSAPIRPFLPEEITLYSHIPYALIIVAKRNMRNYQLRCTHACQP